MTNEGPATNDCGFPKKRRLRVRRQFLAVQRRGRRLGTDTFVVYGRANGGRYSRIGITVSRKVGHAVTRNRVKRLVREVFRTNQESIPRGIDFVVVAKQEAAEAGLLAVKTALLGAFLRLSSLGAERQRSKRRAGDPGR